MSKGGKGAAISTSKVIVAIDRYAETALGNREYFLNRPCSIGEAGGRKPEGRVFGIGRVYWSDEEIT